MNQSKVSEILFSLAETDKEIQQLMSQRKSVEEKRAVVLAALTKTKERLSELEVQYKDGASRYALEEHRLRDEEKKIVERRKQLNALGGVKSAKLMERELDIAGRVLQNLEQSVNSTQEGVERAKELVETAREEMEKLQGEYNEISKDGERTIKTLEKDLTRLETNREKQLGKIDLRLKNLYRKVNSRYPGEAVALARDGSCRSCYRALPAQLFNQIIAGNLLIQCPGCSRILVHSPSSDNGK